MPSRTTGWSSTIATRMGRALSGHVAAARAPAAAGLSAPPDQTTRTRVPPSGRSSTASSAPSFAARCAMVRNPRWPGLAGLARASSPTPGPRSSTSSSARAGLGAKADRDRRAAVLDGVGDGLLRDAVEPELDVVRQPLLSVVAEVDVDPRCGPHLADERLERGREPEVVDDRQAEVGADRPQPVDRGAQRGGGLVLARAVEPVDEHREVLDHVVVDVRGDPRALRLALVHHQTAVARFPGGLAGDGQDSDDPGDAHDGEPDDERLEERRRRECRERGERDRGQRRENGDVAGAEHGREATRAGQAAGVAPELRREDERRHERHRRGEGPAQVDSTPRSMPAVTAAAPTRAAAGQGSSSPASLTAAPEAQ